MPAYPGQPRPLPEEKPTSETTPSSSDTHPAEESTPAPEDEAKPGRRSLQELATIGFEPGPLERRLQSYLPLFKNLAGKFADRLPLPLGFDFVFVQQWNKQIFTSNQVTFRDRTFNVPSQDFSILENSSTSYMGVVDAWVFPFMNIYGAAGYTTTELQFDVTLPEFQRLSGRVERTGHGYSAGGGTVIGGAYNGFFGLVDVTYLTTDLNIFTENIETFVVAPRIGYERVLGRLKGTISVGPNYYRQSTLRASTFDFRGEEIDLAFKVKEKNPWNTSVGVRLVVFHRFDVSVSGSFGSRRGILARVGARF